MDVTLPLALLGSISPEYWQKKPLLIRNAVPMDKPVIDRAALLNLAASEEVESRLVTQVSAPSGVASGEWRMRSGPFARKSLPALKTPGWTLLVQGVDLHLDAAHAFLSQFRFVPDARLDDLMISFATDGGGVGPHFDSYDVFLLQAQGQRRWRIGAQKDLALVDGAPLKILADFRPDQTFTLNPGDMLYLPPHYAHEGTAVGECMTYSIGFRAPQRGELAREILLRLADAVDDSALYADRAQTATAQPARLPAGILEFAIQNIANNSKHTWGLQGFDLKTIAAAVGETLTEPKVNVWFDDGQDPDGGAAPPRPDLAHALGLRLDRRSKMLFDDHHIFINGEHWQAGGADMKLMQKLANERSLTAAALKKASPAAQALLGDWCEQGWAHAS